jgi:hypothetical protein
MWIGISIAVVILAFLVWRITSVGRGAKQRDRRIYSELEGVARLLEGGQELTQDQVVSLGDRHELRGMLYFFLKQGEKLDLAPDEWRTVESQAKAQLAYWMMHPNELCDPAEQIEIVEMQERSIGGRAAQFACLKYRMPEGHWAGRDWQLGVAGPYFEDSLPYDGEAGAFARVGDVEGKVPPAELIDWYIGMATGQDAQQDARADAASPRHSA